MENKVQQIHDLFKELEMDVEKHQYSVGNNTLKGSVSSKIKRFTKYVDFDKKAEIKASRLGITKDELLNTWKTKCVVACENGTKVHLYGELYPFNRDMKPTCKKEEAVKKFWDELPDYVVPACLELKMYHLKYMFAGTADVLLYNKKTDKFIIADFKTNEDLFKNFKNTKLLYPFNELLDNPFNKYQIQLSYYQLLFEQTSFEVSHRNIVWLLPDGTYKMYSTKNYTEELKEDLHTEYKR